MEFEHFFKAKEYKDFKKQHEKSYFKLFGKYCHIDDNVIEIKTPADMQEKFINRKLVLEVEEESQTKKGVTTTTRKQLCKSYFEIWRNDPEIIEYDKLKFECDLSKVKKSDYNLFTGFNHFESLEKKDIDLTPVFDHIKSLVNFDDEHFNYVLCWLAQLVQHPEKLPDTALIFISPEGVGKDLFGEFLEKVVGSKYFDITEKLGLICGTFNTILGGKLLFIVNEANPIESSQRIENLKSIITAKTLQIEGKYKDPIKTNNFCRFIFFSNRPFAFPVEEGSRRPVIFQASDKFLPVNYGEDASKKHFTNLADNILKNKYYQFAFLRFLKGLDISKFNPRTFKKSELHETLQSVSINPLVGFIAQLIKDNDINQPLKMKSSDALAMFGDYMRNERHMKFDYGIKKFIVELKSNFNVSTTKNSISYIIWDLKYLKDLLIQKYKYNFDEDRDENIKENPLNYKPDSDYKKELQEKDDEIERLKRLLKEATKPEHLESLEKELEEFEKLSPTAQLVSPEGTNLLSEPEMPIKIKLVDEVESYEDLIALDAQHKQQKKANAKKSISAAKKYESTEYIDLENEFDDILNFMKK